MARIVPGKPKMPTEHLNVRLTQLQDVISDDAVIFQEFGRDNSVLVLQESIQPHVLIFLNGVADVDMDVREVIFTSGEDMDLETVVKDAHNAAGDLDLIDIGFTICIDGTCNLEEDLRLSVSGVPSQVRITMNADTLRERAVETAGVTTIDEIDGIIQQLNPGASAFVPGTVSSGQARWRRNGQVHAREASPQAPEQASLPVQEDKASAPETSKPSENERVASASDTRAQKETGPVRVARRAPITLNAKSAARVKFIEDLAANTLNNIAGDKPVFSTGLDVDPSFVCGADAFLPVLLVAASDRWAPVVAKAGGISGFDVRMRRDGEALLGFRVVNVLASSPFTLFTPIAAVLRESMQVEEMVLDENIEIFHRWVMKYRLDDVELEDISMKIALGAI